MAEVAETEKTAKVKTGNQEFPIPYGWVKLDDQSQEAKNQRDARIRRQLSGIIPSITNGSLDYKEENGETIVRVTPQLGTKATAIPQEGWMPPASIFPTEMHCDLNDVHILLRDAPSYLSPVLKLAWELKWKQSTGTLTFEDLLAYQPRIREVLESTNDAQVVEQIHRRLRELPPSPAPAAALGF